MARPRKRTITVEKFDNTKYDASKMQPELKFGYRVKDAQNTLTPSLGECLTFYQVNQLIADGVTVNVREKKPERKP